MFDVLLLSAGAGVIGTGTGGIAGLIFGKKSDATVSYLLSFAAGVMLSIVFFDLIPEAIELSGTVYTVFAIIGGAICIWALNRAVDIITGTRGMHVLPGELRHQESLIANNRSRSMLKSGLLMFTAIALHNLPEGMAIGSGAAHNDKMGLMLAVLIALHNIPEGISIGVPLIEGGMNRAKAVFLTAVSGFPTFIGGWIGARLGNIGESFIAASLAFAGGAMLYVTFCEILPQSTLLNHTRRPAVFAVAGVLFGLIIVRALS
jgi:ZIP family zinc transporter